LYGYGLLNRYLLRSRREHWVEVLRSIIDKTLCGAIKIQEGRHGHKKKKNVGLARIVWLTVYDRMYGNFPVLKYAVNREYRLYVQVYVWL
jgi:hypothetical protein